MHLTLDKRKTVRTGRWRPRQQFHSMLIASFLFEYCLDRLLTFAHNNPDHVDQEASGLAISEYAIVENVQTHEFESTSIPPYSIVLAQPYRQHSFLSFQLGLDLGVPPFLQKASQWRDTLKQFIYTRQSLQCSKFLTRVNDLRILKFRTSLSPV